MIRRLIKQRISSPLRRAVRDLQMELYISRRHRAGVRRAARFAGAPSLRLNLGSGFQAKKGWVNVDLSDLADLTLDLRQPLPFEDNSVSAIYSEHFFEHLAVDEQAAAAGDAARSFLGECWRVLRPGALLEIVVPDAEGIVQEYVARREQPFPQHAWWGPKWCDTAMHCVNYVFRQGREHQYAYDCDTLAHVLEQTGFGGVRRRAFDPAIEAANHEIGSLCMQARKPTHVVARRGRRRTARSWRPQFEALRQIRAEWRTRRLHRAAVAKAQRLTCSEPLRLRLGSDGHAKDGWITVDAGDPRADLRLDLRERLPFADQSVSHVRLEHFLERVSYPDLTESTAWELEPAQSEALRLLRECRRVLLPGGRFDLICVDAEAILNAYVARGTRPFRGEQWRSPEGCDTPMQHVNHLFRDNGAHQYVYDGDTLERMLNVAGFVEVTRPAEDSAIDAGRDPRPLLVHARTPAASCDAAETAA
jgi:predicted SAM-dependent methyltransferase